MRFILFCLLWLCLVAGCRPGQSHTASTTLLQSDSIRYAQGFSVDRFSDHTVVEVHDPWDSTQILQRYILIKRDKPRPKGLPSGTIVEVPIRNIAVYTSVHASILDQLQAVDEIIAVCEPRYMDMPAIQSGIETGRIEIGRAHV